MTSPLTVQQKQAANVWDHVDDALAVIEMARAGKWVWMENSRCKYIDLRIDMRDGGCLIRDAKGNRINPEDLRKQLSNEQWEPWPAERVPLGDWQKEVASATAKSGGPTITEQGDADHAEMLEHMLAIASYADAPHVDPHKALAYIRRTALAAIAKTGRPI